MPHPFLFIEFSADFVRCRMSGSEWPSNLVNYGMFVGTLIGKRDHFDAKQLALNQM